MMYKTLVNVVIGEKWRMGWNKAIRFEILSPNKKSSPFQWLHILSESESEGVNFQVYKEFVSV